MDIMKHDFLIYKRSIIVFAQIKGVNETKSVKFILDTGASKSIISNSAAIRLGFDLKRLNAGDKLMPANGSISSKILKLPKFSLFGKNLINFEVNALNMPPQITYIADGLIGMDFLLQFQNIKIDFDKKIIET
jgi:clan AA aspartic protease (TIGR02281 family)